MEQNSKQILVATSVNIFRHDGRFTRIFFKFYCNEISLKKNNIKLKFNTGSDLYKYFLTLVFYKIFFCDFVQLFRVYNKNSEIL